LRSRNEIDARIVRKFYIPRAERIGVQQRGPLLPILGRRIGLDQEWIGTVATEQRPATAGERIGHRRRREGKVILDEIVVLVVGAGAVRLAKANIEAHTAGARGVRQHAVKDATALLVLVEALRNQIAQEARR